MDLKLTDLEKKLFASAKPDLARGALVASGISTLREMNGYLSKINTLCQQLQVKCAGRNDLEKARYIFDRLWEAKPNRSERRGSFRLTEVINAQLASNSEHVGNCLGLTLLFNVLAQKCGLNIEAVYCEDVLGQGPHVFSTMQSEHGTVDIEHIHAGGFDCREHLKNPLRITWGDAELIADIYHSTGNKFFEKGDHEEAVQCYSKAIRLNPQYTKAYLNRALALFMLGKNKEAIKDLEHREL